MVLGLAVAVSMTLVIAMLVSIIGEIIYKKVCGDATVPLVTEKDRKQPLSGYIPFKHALASQSLVVDCTHPSADQITHHKDQYVPEEIRKGMLSSSDGVLNAILLKHPLVTNHTLVTSNHFDIDSFISVWSFLNQKLAVEHEAVLREVARIGDFRELRLDHPHQHFALKLCCWLNTVEKRRFYIPFGSSSEKDDSVEKFHFFLPKFNSVLEDIGWYKTEWIKEYRRVLKDYSMINKVEFKFEDPDRLANAVATQVATPSSVSIYPDIGIAIVSCPDPVHYYALFSVGLNACDVVVSIYSGQRYELEIKYTTYVDVDRPVMPRVNLQTLVRVLNSHEDSESGAWHASSFADSGPLLRIDLLNEEGDKKRSQGTEKNGELNENKNFSGPMPVLPPNGSGDRSEVMRSDGAKAVKTLSKAERYGHPYERPIYASSISPDLFKTLVLSYFRWAYSTNHGLRDSEYDSRRTEEAKKEEEGAGTVENKSLNGDTAHEKPEEVPSEEGAAKDARLLRIATPPVAHFNSDGFATPYQHKPGPSLRSPRRLDAESPGKKKISREISNASMSSLLEENYCTGLPLSEFCKESPNKSFDSIPTSVSSDNMHSSASPSPRRSRININVRRVHSLDGRHRRDPSSSDVSSCDELTELHHQTESLRRQHFLSPRGNSFPESLLKEDSTEERDEASYDSEYPMNSEFEWEESRVWEEKGGNEGEPRSLWTMLQVGEYAVIKAKKQWTWREIRRFNKCINWSPWEKGIARLETDSWNMIDSTLNSVAALLEGPKNISEEKTKQSFENESKDCSTEESIPAGEIPPPPFTAGAGIPPPPPLPPTLISLARGIGGMAGGGAQKKLRSKPEDSAGKLPEGTELKRLHWIPVDTEDPGFKKSVWAEMKTDLPLDVEEISKLFAVRKSARRQLRGTAAKKTGGCAVETAALLDAKREMNIAIALSGMRMLPDELFEAILSIDLSVLTPDKFPQLLSLLPTAEEAKIVASFRGAEASLTPASRLHWLLLGGSTLAAHGDKTHNNNHPNEKISAEERRKFISDWLEHIGFVHSLPGTLKKIHNSISHLNLAAGVLRRSQRMRNIARVTLTLGNYMNFGSNTFCDGFGAESLLKLPLSKSDTNRSVNLLDMVASIARKRFPDTCGDEAGPLTKELKHVVSAARVESDQVSSELGTVKRKLKVLGRELKRIAIEMKTEASSGNGGVKRANGMKGMGHRFYHALTKRFVKCARVHDSLQKNMKATLAKHAALLRFWGEDPTKRNPEFEKMENFYKVFSEFAHLWDGTTAKLRDQISAAWLQGESKKPSC